VASQYLSEVNILLSGPGEDDASILFAPFGVPVVLDDSSIHFR